VLALILNFFDICASLTIPSSHAILLIQGAVPIFALSHVSLELWLHALAGLEKIRGSLGKSSSQFFVQMG
jgi:hypothetical protein